MWHRIKRAIVLINVLMFIFFGIIYLYMNEVAQSEQARLRMDIYEVQKNIAENMSGDYDEGLKLVDGLMVESSQFNQKINCELLDEVIKDTSETELLPTLNAFFKNERGALEVYDLQNGNKLYSIGDKTLASGKALNQYKYYMKNKPWLMVVNRPYVDQTGPKTSAAQLLTDNMHQVHKYLQYELMLIGTSEKIIKASSNELLGQKVIHLEPLPNKRQSKAVDERLYALELQSKDGTIQKYIGIVSDSGPNKIVFATDESRFNFEYRKMSRFLIGGMILNLLLGIACLQLIIRNYMYFAESESVGGEL